MTIFGVWAPNATSMQTETDGQRYEMNPGENNWWSVDIPNARHGDDYAFCINGGEALPDPRSGWQPYGVYGPSRLVQHRTFQWTDQTWQSKPFRSALIYELHVGTFTPEGTFDSIIPKLEYLYDLGVTHIELLPVNEFSGEWGWGYDGVLIYAPHHAYGGPESMKRLIDAAHKVGIGVILDVVYNHFGPEGCHLSQFGPYFTNRYATPWGDALNLDGFESDQVRRYLIDNAMMWLREYHCDGLRIDGVHEIIDTSAYNLVEQMVEEIETLEAKIGKHLFVIAESDWNDPRIVRRREVGGYGCSAQWSDDFHHALHTVLTGEQEGYYRDFGSYKDLAKAMQKAFIYDGCYSQRRKRSYGRPTTGLTGHRFLAFLQNHDQVGNRATGDRISDTISLGKIKIGSAMILFSAFVPMIFQGEEWAASTPFQFFTNYQSPELASAVSKGRKEGFAYFNWNPDLIPDPQDKETFERSKINWDERSREPHAQILHWYRRLIKLRHKSSELCNGHMESIICSFDQEAQWFVAERGEFTLVSNLANYAQQIPIRAKQPRHILLESDAEITIEPEHAMMPPESVLILGPQVLT